MFYLINLTESLVVLLQVTIVFRSFFPLKRSDRFLAFPYLLASAAVFGFRIFPSGILSLCLACLVCLLYVRLLFTGGLMKMTLLGLMLAFLAASVYLLCFVYLRRCLTGLLPAAYLRFTALLIGQLVIYVLLFLVRAGRMHRKIAVTYYFPVVPVILTFVFLGMFRELQVDPAIVPVLIVFLMILIAFDFGCLALQSWMIILLNNRTAIRMEQVRQEYLDNKYRILKEQYQNSFDFLHSLLRSCSDLSVTIEQQDMTQIEEGVKEIAGTAFVRFNEVCISAPVLSELLEQKKQMLEKEQILVSTVIRNDHFGLLTFDEQRDLFSKLLDFSLEQCRKSDRKVRTLVIKSMEENRDIVLFLRFPAASDPSSTEEFRQLQKQLSRKFQAGLQLSWQKDQNICTLILIMPMALGNTLLSVPKPENF